MDDTAELLSFGDRTAILEGSRYRSQRARYYDQQKRDAICANRPVSIRYLLDISIVLKQRLKYEKKIYEKVIANRSALSIESAAIKLIKIENLLNRIVDFVYSINQKSTRRRFMGPATSYNETQEIKLIESKLSSIDIWPFNLADMGLLQVAIGHLVRQGSLDTLPRTVHTSLNCLYWHFPLFIKHFRDKHLEIARVRSQIVRVAIGLSASWRNVDQLHYWLRLAAASAESNDPLVSFNLSIAHAYLHQHGYKRAAGSADQIFSGLNGSWSKLYGVAPSSVLENMTHSRDFHLGRLSLASGASFDQPPLAPVIGKIGSVRVQDLAMDGIHNAIDRKNIEGICWMSASFATVAIDRGDYDRGDAYMVSAVPYLSIDPDRVHPSTRANFDRTRLALALRNREACPAEVRACLAALKRLKQAREIKWLQKYVNESGLCPSIRVAA